MHGGEPLPDGDSAAHQEQPQADVQGVRDPEAGEAGADQHQDQPLGAEATISNGFPRVLEQPGRHRNAVIRTRGVRMLGREAVVDRHDRAARAGAEEAAG